MDKKTILIILVVLVLAVGGFFAKKNTGTRRAVAGIPDPVQKEASGTETMEVGKYKVNFTKLYSYDIKALVVHTKDYPETDLAGKLAPKDLALAWGKVAEYNDRIDFNWRQSGRWYYWSTSTYAEIAPVGSVAGVTHCSANNHIIPATVAVRDKVKKIKTGDYIHMTGYLVNINATGSDGSTFYWNSSTSRDDSGDGSCEVFYVTDIQWMD
jgi:hypothetical protein